MLLLKVALMFIGLWLLVGLCSTIFFRKKWGPVDGVWEVWLYPVMVVYWPIAWDVHLEMCEKQRNAEVSSNKTPYWKENRYGYQGPQKAVHEAQAEGCEEQGADREEEQEDSEADSQEEARDQRQVEAQEQEIVGIDPT